MTQKVIIGKEDKYDTTKIAKWIRQELKNNYPDLKVSVRTSLYSGGSSISIVILKSESIRFRKTINEIEQMDILRFANSLNITEEEGKQEIIKRLSSTNYDINQYWVSDDMFLTVKGKKTIKDILAIVNKHNWDNSDSQTDYFDVNYYVDIGLGNYEKEFVDGDEQ